MKSTKSKKKTQKQGPECKTCGATENTPFAMFPKTAGESFGTICVPCDEKEG